MNNVFAIQDAAQGFELSGGHQYGGYHYSLAFVNQNTSGTSSTAPNVSSPAGFFSDSNYKDFYGRFSYRFNLEKDPASRHDIQAAGATGPRDHTYLTLGTFYFKGRSVQRFNGVDASDNATVITAREPFYRVGGDFSFNYRTLNVFGLYMYGHDDDLLCQDSTGTAIACSSGIGTSFTNGAAAKFNGGFIEADYLVLALGHGHHALRPRAVDGGLPEPGRVGELLLAGGHHAQPGNPGRAVPDSRQHQGVVRIRDPSAAGSDSMTRTEKR